MTDRASLRAPEHRDFFISRSTKDVAFAQWVCALIAAQGKTYVEQSEHFGHQDFMGAMHEALASNAKVVALYSEDYFRSDHCLKEATTALTGDSFNKLQRLIPLRIRAVTPMGMLANVAYTDLWELRQRNDATALAVAIMTALGFTQPKLDGLAPPPADALVKRVQVTPDKFRLKTGHLKPRPALVGQIASAFRTPQPVPGALRAAITNDPYVMQALAGMGGVGKTMLALDYARGHAADYEGVWWVEAETRQSLLRDLAALGARLSPSLGSKAASDLDGAARDTLRLIEAGDFEKPWLIVYDNVEKPGDIDDLTPTANAHVLVTTRWSDWHSLAGKIDVGLFTPDEAADFLCARAGRSDRDAAKRLAEALGHLPLALDHAASFVRSRNRTFDTYRDDVADLIKTAPKSGASFALYHDETKKVPASVYGTFRLALNRIIEGDSARDIAPVPEAAAIMGLTAFLAPDLIPRKLLDQTTLPSAGVDDALAALAEVSLVTLGETARGEPAFSTHRLVQLVAQGLVTEQNGTRQLIEVGLDLVDANIPHATWEYANRALCDELATHGTALIDHAKANAVETATVSRLARKLGNLLETRAQYAEAGTLFERALTIADAVHGPQSTESSLVLHVLGVLRQAQGRYSEAEPLLQRSLAIYEKTVGGEHPDTSTTLHELARLYQSQGRYGEAEPLLQRSLAIKEKTVGGEHPSTVNTKQMLASVYQSQGLYAQAEPLFVEGVTLDEKLLGRDHPETATSLSLLASLYQAQGRYSQAEPLLQRSLAIKEKTVGGEHPHTSATLHELASLYQAQGRYSEAEPLLKRSLAIKEKTVGREHPDTSTTLHELASLYQAQGRYSEAEPLLKRSLAIYEKTVGGEHPSTSATLHVLASLYQAQGRYSDAEPLLQRSLAIDEKIVGGEHPSTSATLHELARLYQAQGRYSDAEPLLQRSLAIKEKTVGGEHPDTATTLHELARLYQAQGRYSEAEPLLQRSLAIYEKTVGGEHPHTGITLRSLAELACEAGQVSEARGYLDRATAVLAPHWKAQHVRWAQVLNVAALVELAEGNPAEAEASARAAVERRLSTLSDDHPHVAHSKWTLARAMLALGRVGDAEPLLREAVRTLAAKVTDEHVWLKGARATQAELKGSPSAAEPAMAAPILPPPEAAVPPAPPPATAPLTVAPATGFIDRYWPFRRRR
jgi:tetratricopeptide (TPR) repeat protein